MDTGHWFLPFYAGSQWYLEGKWTLGLGIFTQLQKHLSILGFSDVQAGVTIPENEQASHLSS